MKNLPFLFILLFFSCQSNDDSESRNLSEEQIETDIKEQKEITILLSKDADTSFIKWLGNIDSNVNYIDVYELSFSDLEEKLSLTDGILIAGGNDVNACIYGKDSEVERCGAFDQRRDTLELKMIDYAIQNKVPLLCVCRGEQIFNVSQGGTLIIDIPTDFGTKVDHSGKTEKNHLVYLHKGTLLYEIGQVDSASVNSFHHQAVDELAGNLIVSANAPDSLVEAIELKDKSSHPFVLGVQWHPELIDTSSPLSNPIGRRFIEEAYIFSDK